ncbi:MAG: aspartate aminotransferase family protein [Myxococcota bacterium]
MESWVDRGQRVLVGNYRPAPLVLDRGEGVYVYDRDGRKYLDMTSGIAVSALGHGHPRLVAAVQAQAAKILHTSNLYWNQPSVELAERLVAESFGDRVFFCNSGAEANEACIKLARRYHHARGDEQRTEIVSFRRSFHGRTMGALAATAQPKYHEGFRPLPGGFVHLDVGFVNALRRATGPRTAAILIEPVQGEGGVRPVPVSFLQALQQRADEVGALLIVDEVQSGFGRTGDVFAYQGAGIRPDIMALAKGIAGGVPMGAMVAREAVAQALQPGTHGTTYGGSPLACAAGCVVMAEVARPEFLQHVQRVGSELIRALRLWGSGLFSEVRGRGLMVGADLRPSCGWSAADVVHAVREEGVLLHVAGPRTLRFVPPLIVESVHVEEAISALDRSLSRLPRAA